MKLTPEDQKIYELCQRYGTEALEARRKFAGLLPEVLRRRIYEKKGYSSIFEFAAKLSGMSQEQVRVVLNLEKRLEDKPVLKNLLISGEVSFNKLARIVAIATPENQENLATTVKLLSKSALEVFVRDEKFAAIQSTNFSSEFALHRQNENALPVPLFEDESLPGQSLNFQLSDEIIQQLNTLHSQGHDMNELLKNLLSARQEKIQKTKNEISENIAPAKSRYIPVKIKTILREQYGEKCSIKNCKKPAETIHHQQHFAVSQNHDPNFLVPLCQAHHEIAHTVDLHFHRSRKSRAL